MTGAEILAMVDVAADEEAIENEQKGSSTRCSRLATRR